MRSRNFLLQFVIGVLWLYGITPVFGSENVALKKTVMGQANSHASLVDGNAKTAIKPKDGNNPFIWIDLKNLYKIEYFELYAQDEQALGTKGINTSFSLYVWANYTSVCDMEGLYPWTLVKGGLTFSKKGEMIKVDTSVEAQYVILRPDFTDYYQTNNGLPLGELKAFGSKIRDGYTFQLPEDGVPLENVWMNTRQKILKNQPKLMAQVSYFQYLPDPQHKDVSLGWYYDQTHTMAAVRGKARMIVTSGPAVIRKILNASDYTALRENAREYLSPGNANAKYSNVSEQYVDGDILVITRFDKFDVAKVVADLKSGKNSAIISYISEREPRENLVAKLFGEMGIKYQNMPTSVGYLEQSTAEFYDSSKDIPWDFELQIGLSSWKQFSAEEMKLFIPSEELNTSKIQGLVRQVLDKYHDLFTYLAPCRDHPYKQDKSTQFGLWNYNKVLLLQRGENVRPAPGALRSPGHVKPTAKPTTFTVEYKPMPQYSRFLPTGGYAAPGKPIRYKILSYSTESTYYGHIRINPSIYKLVPKASIARWPLVTHSQLLAQEGMIISPFGGPIVINVWRNYSLKIQFEGAYRHPVFDIRDPQARGKWEEEKRKFKGCPYGFILGDNMHSMLEEAVLLKQDAETIFWNTQFFDNIVKCIHNYRGSDYLNAKYEVLVTDDELIKGLAHNGYPWMGYRDSGDVFVNKSRNMLGQNFLFPHEIGHNLQVWPMTFVNGREVTNNMYIPVVRTYVNNLDGYKRPGIRPGNTPDELERMVANWKSGRYTGVQESFYNYLSIEFSPALIANVLPYGLDENLMFGTEELKVSFWVKHICQEAKYNLVPFHELWHMPINKEAQDICRQFPCWFPDDEYTKQVPELVNKILKDYNNTCQRTKPTQVEFKRDIRKGFNTTQPQVIFITNQ